MEKLRLTEVRTIYLLPVAVMEDSSSKPGSVPLVTENLTLASSTYALLHTCIHPDTGCTGAARHLTKATAHVN